MAFTSKPMASLSSGLLARKGEARPAMRPQGGAGIGSKSLEDLGWNDMGDPLPAASHPGPRPAAPVAIAPVAQATPEPAPSGPAVVAPSPAIEGKRAAFTLRLDPDRHLRLRLASAVRGCSSQWLVTQALDAFLDAIPQNAPGGVEDKA